MGSDKRFQGGQAGQEGRRLSWDYYGESTQVLLRRRVVKDEEFCFLNFQSKGN